jgi:hypothetical protein
MRNRMDWLIMSLDWSTRQNRDRDSDAKNRAISYILDHLQRLKPSEAARLVDELALNRTSQLSSLFVMPAFAVQFPRAIAFGSSLLAGEESGACCFSS